MTNTIPFPDLTGLRTTAHDRNKSKNFIETQRNCSLNFQDFKKVSANLFQDVEIEEIIITAFLVILTHLLSPENECCARIALVNNAKDEQSISYTKYDLETDNSVRTTLRLDSIIKEVQQSRTISKQFPAQCEVALFFSYGEKEGGLSLAEVSDEVTIVHQIRFVNEGQIIFSTTSSPRLHTLESAALHLAQTDALIQTFFRTNNELPIFSTLRFSEELLASDNPQAKQIRLKDDEELNLERFEYQFERMARRNPSRIALEFRKSINAAANNQTEGNTLLTYEEVEQYANAIATKIQASVNYEKVSKEGNKIVSLYLEKSPWTYIAILGVLKAGAAWCPIDTDWPSARRTALLKKSGASIVLTAGDQIKNKLESELPNGMILIDLGELDVSSANNHATLTRNRGKSSEDLAYLIWTSGTTGLPKAVGIQHKAAVQALRSLQAVIPYQDSKLIRYLQFSAYNFDLMILDMFYTWGLGGTLCSSTRNVLLTDLIGLANATKATHTLLTPAVMAITPRGSIPSLQVVINGGEKLSQVVADLWSVDCCLLNLYGPAEATLIAMHRCVPMNDVVKAPNIGRALSTTSCHVIDSQDYVVIKGAVGQLALGGFQCAIGYVGDVEKTSDKFYQHPTLGRIYKTGDMVRQLYNGDFEYLGRVDDQIKIHGIRIELLEINAAIKSSNDHILDSETLLISSGKKGDESDAAQIVNFSVIPSQERSDRTLIRLDDEAVKLALISMEHVKNDLPAYMIPSLFLIVNYFPKTSSAKIDRESLKSELRKINIYDWQNRLAEQSQTSSSNTEYSNSDLEIENTIRSYISDFCHIRPELLGRYTPFPQLGIDSIRAISLVKRLNEAGFEVSVVEILAHSTLSKLSTFVRATTKGNSIRRKEAREVLGLFDASIRPGVSQLFQNQQHIERIQPCTPLQESLISETLQDRSRYWLHRVYSIPDLDDPVRMKEVIHKFTGSVEVLRTSFIARSIISDFNLILECNYIQVVSEHPTVKIVESTMQTSEDDVESIALQSAELHDLEVLGTRPPLAFTILQKEKKLIMHIHHALYDQQSLSTMDRILSALWSKGEVDRHEPFSKAVPLTLPINNDETRQRRSTWERLLKNFPKGDTISPPRLTMRQGKPPGSSIESTRSLTGIHYATMAQRAQDMNLSLRPILQTALAFVLSRLCDTQSILLGDVISGRAISSTLNSVIGPVLTTMAVPIQIQDDKTFKKVSNEVAQFHSDAMLQAYISLGQVRQILNLPRSSDLFHAVLSLELFEDENQTYDLQNLKVLGNYGIAVEHDLAIEIEVNPQGYLDIIANTKKAWSDINLVKSFLHLFEKAIVQLTDRMDESLSTFDLEGDLQTESISQIEVLNPSILEEYQTPHFNKIIQQSKDDPTMIAIEFHESIDGLVGPLRTTYGELMQRSNLLAQYLCKNLSAKSIVAVTLSRSVDTYVALLGIFLSGCIYLPIDIALPQQRKMLLLQESKAQCIIHHSSTEWFKESSVMMDILKISMDRLDWTLSSDIVSLPKVDPSDPAYILFTSGSTGIPKGCILSHLNLSAALCSFRRVYEQFAPGSLEGNVRFLARSIESFDVALLEALLPLQIGATIVTAPRHVILSDLGKSMRALKVTHAAVVSSLFYLEGVRVKPSDLPDLRALIVGGERLAKDIVDLWSSSSIPLLNAYGPTEACIGTSIARVQNELSTGNIGQPFESTQYAVLKKRASNSEWTVAMRGEVGELCISGFQVGSYLNQTKPDTFIQWRDRLFYRTGDEVLMWPDGSVEYLGRVNGDTQVKIRGVRTELGEIDSGINNLDDLKPEDGAQIRSITRFLSHPLLKDQIVTFAASRTIVGCSAVDQLIQLSGPADQALASKLYNRCRKVLPTHMVPSIIVILEAVPLAAISGKYDAKMLASWYAAQMDPKRLQMIENLSEKDRRLTEIEQSILRSLANLFKIDQGTVKYSTDLFSLGLDSLNLTALSALLTQSGIRVSVGDIMSEPTLEGIARNARMVSELPLNHQSGKQKWQRLTNLARNAVNGETEIEYALPCLPLQASMVSQTLIEFQQWNERPTKSINLRYVNSSHYKLSEGEGITVALVEDALNHVLSRHDIYRTVFVELDEKISQIVLATWTKSLVSVEKGENWESAAIRSIAKYMHRFPPIRYRVWQSKASSDINLDLVIHHALYDGVSLKALFEDIEDYLRSPNNKVNANRSGMTTVILGVESATMEDRLQYWKTELQDASINFFPCLTGHEPDIETTEFDQVQVTMSKSLSVFKELAKERKVTVAMIFLHAFAELCSQYIGEPDIIIGLIMGGRSDNNNIHGPTVNTIPFRFKSIKGEDTLQQARKTYAQALQHQHIPLTELARALDADKGLFNVLFSFAESSVKNGKKPLFTEETSKMDTEYPLALEVLTSEEEDSVNLLLQFNKGFIPPKQAQIILSQIDDKFCQNVDFHQDILSIENLDAEQVPLIHFLELFSGHAKNQPQAVAFGFTEDLEEALDWCTYKQLDDISDRIAFMLQNIVGDIVGVFMSQCKELYPLLLGLWKAGKSYLPLDSNWPEDRLEYVVQLTKPSLIVTSNKQVSFKSFGSSQVLNYFDLITTGERAFISPFPKKTRSIDETAYIMFTSGSSGKPKGVQISHKALAAALRSWQDILPHQTGKSRMLQLASPGFDVFMIEVCMPLALGFSFASAPKDILLNDLEKTFNHLELTIADLPAALATTIDPSNIPSLEWLMSGGEQMDQRVIDAWSESGLINAWGPTETAIGNTLGFVKKGMNKSWIGFAYPTSALLILEQGSERILPRGCIGEIVVGGPQLGDGYYGDSKLTQKSFINIVLPGLIKKKMRVYRTGDRGRILSDGSIECFGRIEGDGQIKINSQRIELKEIDIALRQNVEVKDACVMYLSHPQIPKKQLVAFLIPKTSSANDDSTKIEILQDASRAKYLARESLSNASKTLAAYMVPQICLVLASSSLPLTSNNKIDLRKIKSFYEQLDVSLLNNGSTQTTQHGQRSFTRLESKLQTLLSEFVGVDRDSIALHTSLHRLGVDSISGLRLARFLRNNGIQSITAKSLLKSSSLESLAKIIDENEEANKRKSPDILYPPVDFSRQIQVNGQSYSASPCTPLQCGMLLESLANDGELYIHHLDFRLLSKDLAHIQESIRVVCNRHDILRSTFHFVDGNFFQAFHPKEFTKINIVRLKTDGLDFNDVKKVKEQHRKHLSTEQGLGNNSLMTTLVKGEIYSHLVITLHHALYDGESLEMLISQLIAEADKKRCDVHSIQFRDVLPTLLPSGEAGEFWRRRLTNCKDSLISKIPPKNFDSLFVQLPLSIGEDELTRFAKEIEVSVHIITLYSYAKLLAHLIGQRCVTFAQMLTLRTGSDIEEFENVIGPCFNTILTAVDIKENETNVQALQRLQKENDAGRDYRNASLSEVQRLLVKSRGVSCTVDSIFGLQRYQPKPAAEDKSCLTILEMDSGEEVYTSQYSLNIEFTQLDKQFSLTAVAHKQTFTAEKLQETLKDLERVLLDIIENPHSPSTQMPSSLKTLKGLPSGLIEKGVMNGSSCLEIDAPSTNGIHQTPMQKVLVETIADITQFKSYDVPLDSPLTRIGLDSIASMFLAAQLRKKGIKVGVADIVQGKTVKGILGRLERLNKEMLLREGKQESRMDEFEAAKIADYSRQTGSDIEAILPVLPGQLFELSQKHSSIYTFMYRLNHSKRLKLDRIKNAWSTLIKQHSILRTSFVSESSSLPKWEQIVWKNGKDEDAIVKELQIQRSFSVEMKQVGLDSLMRMVPLDLQNNKCPANLSVLHDPQEDIIMLRLHHALYDAWSLPVLIKDLERLYNGFQMEEASSYVSYVRKFNSDRKARQEEAEKYWTNLCKDVDIPTIPSKGTSNTQSNSSFIFLRDCVDEIDKREKSVSHLDGGLPSLIMAAWATVLSHICSPSHGNVSVFGIYITGRRDSFDGIERMTGNCTNVIPVVANMENVHHCLENTNQRWLVQLAEQIKRQLDEHDHLNGITSISDLLRWTGNNVIPWNSTLNILWSQKKGEEEVKNTETSFELIQDVLREEHDSIPNYHQGLCQIDVLPKLQIDVQKDLSSNSLHLGIRWENELFSTLEIQKVMHDFCRLIRLGSGDNE